MCVLHKLRFRITNHNKRSTYIRVSISDITSDLWRLDFPLTRIVLYHTSARTQRSTLCHPSLRQIRAAASSLRTPLLFGQPSANPGDPPCLKLSGTLRSDLGGNQDLLMTVRTFLHLTAPTLSLQFSTFSQPAFKNPREISILLEGFIPPLMRHT